MWFVVRKKIQWLLLFITIVVVGGFTWLSSNNRYLDFRPDYQHTIFHTDFKDHMIATYRFRDVSTAERFYRWIAAFRMSSDNLVTGVGPNNFYNEYKPYAVSAYRTWVSENKDHSTAHNYFLLTMSEQGIPGLIFFSALLFGMFVYAQNLYHRLQDLFFKKIVLTIVAILAIISTVNFLSDLIETDKIGSVFFHCLGVLIAIGNMRKEKSSIDQTSV
jgi:O-antigen ligase